MKKVVLKSLFPKIQWEDHTCGFCAASSVYGYYGMDPEEFRLRDYLGTDHILPYNMPGRAQIERWLGGEDSVGAGTSPMDMLAVLYWDGFDTEIVTQAYGRCKDRLYDHLKSGHPVIAMMYSCFHWVVISGMGSKGVRITDSIIWDDDGREDMTYWLSHEEFARQEHGLIFVSRDDDDADEWEIRTITYADYIREYRRGLGFCGRVLGKNVPRGLLRLFGRERVYE